MMYNSLLIFSALSFFFFGTSCLVSKKLVSEFERYGIPQYRVLTGWLQLLGAAGIVIGFRYMPLLWVSTAGLSLLMAFGVGVRIKIRDGILQTLPALFYCVLNALLFFYLL